MSDLLYQTLELAPPLLVAVILHEVAHGWAAEKLGDPTARKMGRITLNPLAHVDPFMTIILPAMLIALHSPFVFGGAKPVPVNPLHFPNPRRGMAYVAIAGPVMNFCLVLLFWLLLRLLVAVVPPMHVPSFTLILIVKWIQHSILINLVLGTFNLIPVPPLDGGRILVGFLPLEIARRWARLEPYGLIIVMVLLVSGAVEKILWPIVSFFAVRLLG
jgi:Zn-dependent protease